MAHIFFIDDLTRLTIKKDSSLILALALQEEGEEVYLLFEENFYYTNRPKVELEVFSLSGQWDKSGFFLKQFSKGERKKYPLKETDTLHMRLEPPFLHRYSTYLWMLKGLQDKIGLKIINSPQGILSFQEKIFAYSGPSSIDSFVGKNCPQFLSFAKEIKALGAEEIVLKPLSYFQGEGVQKISLDEEEEKLGQIFQKEVSKYQAPMVAQPFCQEVQKGEIRAIFFLEKELGSLLKTPPPGEFISTVARGASYKPISLSPEQKKSCQEVCHRLTPEGVWWVAFDILGNFIQEVNITCPGLLPEVSSANGKLLAKEMVRLLCDGKE